MKKETTLQAENDQAVLTHKKNATKEKEDETKDVQRKFQMPERPALGNQEAWASIDMMIRNKYGSLAQQAEALEQTIPKERRLKWMAT
eukprot:9548516-Karenia_brevis.AAC.1